MELEAGYYILSAKKYTITDWMTGNTITRSNKICGQYSGKLGDYYHFTHWRDKLEIKEKDLILACRARVDMAMGIKYVI